MDLIDSWKSHILKLVVSKIFTKPLPYIALILAHTIWGIHFVVAKVTLQEFPTFTLAFLRFALASLLLLPFFLAHKQKLNVKKEHLPKLVAAGIFIITFNIAFFFAGIERTTAGQGSILTLIIPILSVVLGWSILHEKIYVPNLAGMGLGLLGTLIIIGLPNIFLGNFSPTNFLGNILILLASISFVIGAVFSREMLKIYPSLTVTFIAFLVGMITFFAPALNEYLQNPGWTANITLLGILGLSYIVVLSSISAYFLFEWGLSKTSLISADLFQYIEPFFATLFGVLFLSEVINLEFIIGAILIAGGVYLGTLAKEAHHRHKTHRT